jgi:hypothetical protein
MIPMLLVKIPNEILSYQDDIEKVQTYVHLLLWVIPIYDIVYEK